MVAARALTVAERPDWRWWVTPKNLRGKSIHRWYVFPHSFTDDLVHALMAEWGLGPDDHILDPFIGAGTTLLAAKAKGISATGYDLSPLAVMAARTKVVDYDTQALRLTWDKLGATIERAEWSQPTRPYPQLVQDALPGRLLAVFEGIALAIEESCEDSAQRDFFTLALIGILPEYSHAVATGGWLKWAHDRPRDGSGVTTSMKARVEMMLDDLESTPTTRAPGEWSATEADARLLPDKAPKYSAVITSPPYPNRHDYTRVFGVELMFSFLDWEQTRQLRYQTLHSHPEARPTRPPVADYVVPQRLKESLAKISGKGKDARVSSLVEGYFLDMHLCLREMSRVCLPGAKIALVVGNVQYYGEPILVDELMGEIGERLGLACESILAARYRGNSAQQMGRLGIRPSRESIVVFRKPT